MSKIKKMKIKNYFVLGITKPRSGLIATPTLPLKKKKIKIKLKVRHWHGRI